MDSAQAIHLLSASGVTEREAKKATRCRSNKSVFPSELIKKRRLLLLILYSGLRCHNPNKQTGNPR